MQALRVCGSLSATQVFSTDAGMVRSPVRFMVSLVL
jgi:hypothetical protein